MVAHLGYSIYLFVASTSWQLHLCANSDCIEIIFGRPYGSCALCIPADLLRKMTPW